MPTYTSRRSSRSLPVVRRRAAATWRTLVAALVAVAPVPAGAITIDWVTVGDPGNAGYGSAQYGAVGYTYQIMRFEWTNQQYVEFLNAVDPQGSNPNGIYNTTMGSSVRGGISFISGNAAGAKYAVRTNMAEKPVNNVSWFDGARVANWLQGGSVSYATTASGSTAINTGAYTLSGTDSETLIAKNSSATFWMPTENEWVKAAFYKGGGTNAGYWTYAPQSTSSPTAVAATAVGTGTLAGVSPVTTGNSANFNYGANWNGTGSLGNVTTVGSNGGPSAYGTFDMSGNVGEWNSHRGTTGETVGIRGGAYRFSGFDLAISSRDGGYAAGEQDEIGFRLVRATPILTWNTTSGTWSATAPNWTGASGSGLVFATDNTAIFSSADGGTVTLSGTMQVGSVTVSATAGTYTFVSTGGNLITGGQLTKSGAGTLILSGSNATAGGTSLAAGILRVDNNSSLGSGPLTLAGGTLTSADASARTLSNAVSLSADTTIGDATGTGDLSLSGAVNLGGAMRMLTTAVNVTLAGTVSNGGAGGGLTKSGSGSLTLTAVNSYPAGLVISSGTVFVGNGSTTGSVSGNIQNNSVLVFNRSNALTYPGTISGSGALVQQGGGMLTLTGSVTHAGGTTITSGTLSIGSGSTSGVLAGDVTNNAALVVNRSDAIAFAGVISGSGSLVKSGAGNLTLSASNGFTGVTRIGSGTLTLGNSAALAGSTLDMNSADTGSLAFGVSGSATYRLGGLTGSRNIAATGSAALDVGSNGGTGTYSGAITSAAAFTKSGSGTLTLTGNNTFTGNTTVSAGKLLVNGQITSATTSVAALATLGGSGTIAGAVVVGTSGTLSPGTSPGILTVNSLSLSGSAVTLMEIVGSGTTAGVAGTDYDQVSITSAGGLTFGGFLDFDFANRATAFARGTTFQLFAFSGSTSGDFTTLRILDSSGAYAGLSFSQSPYVSGEWTTGIIPASSGNYLVFSENTGTLAVVPEPSAIALAALGAGIVGWRVSRRRPR